MQMPCCAKNVMASRKKAIVVSVFWLGSRWKKARRESSPDGDLESLPGGALWTAVMASIAANGNLLIAGQILEIEMQKISRTKDVHAALPVRASAGRGSD
jgi:hypothetical protein